jgi:predicted nucleic-acid-binding Zn-ribbon protein
MFECKKCQKKAEGLKFVPFENPSYEKISDPKYKFHIKSVCLNCGAFNGFKKQTPELMKEITNAYLYPSNTNN